MSWQRAVRNIIIIATPVIIIAAIALIYVGYVRSFQYVTVNYVNSQNVTVYEAANTQNENSRTLRANLSKSGEVLKLKKNHNYIISSKGASGYENKQVQFTPGNTPRTVRLNPYYSSAKLQALLPAELGAINQVLSAQYPNTSLYHVQTGKLYHWGDWYGTLLVYAGSYNSYSDNLRVVLAKQNGTWTVKTNPPNITLSRFMFPNIPVDVLNDVNNAAQFQVPIVPPPAGGAHFRAS